MRIVQEAEMHEENMFLSLTYNDDNLPENATLVKKDVQLFLKRLRKFLEPIKIRYYACGEYGETNNRPHYHIIIFGFWPADSQYYKHSSGGNLYTSEDIAKIWKKGYAVFGTVNWETASYTSSYVTKKISGEKEKEHYKGRLPEFAIMSRRPGVGYSFYKKYEDEIKKHDSVVCRGKEMRPPRYYDKILAKDDQKLLDEKKDKRNLFIFDKKGNLKDDFKPERLKLRKKLAELKQKFFMSTKRQGKI